MNLTELRIIGFLSSRARGNIFLVPIFNVLQYGLDCVAMIICHVPLFVVIICA